MDYETWLEVNRKPGGKAEVQNKEWLIEDEGCPNCGNRTWELTEDYWAYCHKCGAGYSTMVPYNRPGELISYMDHNGNYVDSSDELSITVTQPEEGSGSDGDQRG